MHWKIFKGSFKKVMMHGYEVAKLSLDFLRLRVYLVQICRLKVPV